MLPRKKYTLDIFTEKSYGTEFPENTYDADTTEEVSKIVHNCTRKIAGVKQIQILINEPDDREPIGD